MRKRATFIWPQEPYLPSSLFKHFVYLGETAGYVRDFCDVSILDLSVQPESRKQISDMLSQSNFLCIPIEAYTARNAVKLTQLAKQSGSATTVAYGTLASINPTLLSQYFDIVIATGHWERALEKMITDTAEFNKDLCNGIYSVGEPLNESKWATAPLDLLPMRQYDQISPNQLEINVQKGCTFNCSFCAEKTLIPESRIYQRDPRSTMRFLEENPGKRFYLDATTFTNDPEWVLETCDRLSRLNPIRRWKTVTRIDKIDSELIKSMAKAGCYKVGLGLETTSKTIQKQIRKPIKEESVHYATRVLKEAGIQPRLFLIIGVPGQQAGDIRNAQELVKRLGVECRWKDYIPIEEMPQIRNMEEFERFERHTYSTPEIPGLSRKGALELVSIKR